MCVGGGGGGGGTEVQCSTCQNVDSTVFSLTPFILKSGLEGNMTE